MRRLLLLALAALSPSCGGTSTYVFSGNTVEAPDLWFRVEGHKDRGQILAMRADRGIGLGLPYAEDWVFQPTDAKPISGSSMTLRLFATVQGYRPRPKVEEEAFLKEEYVKSMKASSERQGFSFIDAAVTKQGDHFVLEYTNERALPDGGKYVHTHFWTFRQRDDGAVYEAHVSTNHPDPKKRELLCQMLKSILGKDFIVLPPDGK